MFVCVCVCVSDVSLKNTPFPNLSCLPIVSQIHPLQTRHQRSRYIYFFKTHFSVLISFSPPSLSPSSLSPQEIGQASPLQCAILTSQVRIHVCVLCFALFLFVMLFRFALAFFFSFFFLVVGMVCVVSLLRHFWLLVTLHVCVYLCVCKIFTLAQPIARCF